MTVRATTPSETDFRDLNPDPEALAVVSSLATAHALGEFAQLEEKLRLDEDMLFQETDSATSDFIGFVWLILAINEDAGLDPAAVDIVKVVDATLAAFQSEVARASCLTTARAVRRAYLGIESDARRRWTRTGTSIGSARVLDRLAGTLAESIVRRDRSGRLGDIAAPLHVIGRMTRPITTLLSLPEAQKWRFRVTPQGADIEVNPIEVLREWIGGASLADLAETFLADAATPEGRIEQMVDSVTQHFEHFLSWTVGALVELVNGRLEQAGSSQRLCPDLGGYIRYGVSDPAALVLMSSGIRSRRLAHAIVANLPDYSERTREGLRVWLAEMDVGEWRRRFRTSASETLDLLDYTRLRRRSLLRLLLEVGRVELTLAASLAADVPPTWSDPLTLEPIRGDASPAPLGVYSGEVHLLTTASQDHSDLMAILDTGLDLRIELDDQSDPLTLSIELV